MKYSFTAANINSHISHREINTVGVEALLQSQGNGRNNVNNSNASSAEQQILHTNTTNMNSDYYTYKHNNSTNGDTSESNSSSNDDSQRSSDVKTPHTSRHRYTADYQLIEEDIMEESVNDISINVDGDDDIANAEYENDNGDTTCVGIFLKRCQTNTANGLKNPRTRTRRETT